jgi:hypothetical protein
MFGNWFKRTSRQVKPSTRLRLEFLEDRSLPSSSPLLQIAGAHTPPPPPPPFDGLGVQTIISQPPGGITSNVVAQVFPNLPADTSFEFDDFTITSTYKVSFLETSGLELGSAKDNAAVLGQIWTGLPDKGGTLVKQGGGREAANGNLFINFGNVELTPGTYWVTSYVVRNSTFGQWFQGRRLPITGSEEFFYNPQGGFGFGTASIPGSQIFGTSADITYWLFGYKQGGDSPANLGAVVSQLTSGQTHSGGGASDGAIGGNTSMLIGLLNQQSNVYSD